MLSLLPFPRHLTRLPGTFQLPQSGEIGLIAAEPAALRFTALRLQTALRSRPGFDWGLHADDGAAQSAVVLRLRPELGFERERYRLTITETGAQIVAGHPAGLFHGVSTLLQIHAQSADSWPCLSIDDWPDFAARGVMLDISRDKVPTLAGVCSLVDRLAGWKINQFQLYTEHTFAYRAHREVWEHASPFTGDDILALDAYCRERHIELVPNQNSFGHLHRWFEHPRYRQLAEVTDGYDTPWGTRGAGSFSLCPGDPGSLDLVRGWYDELLPHFSSRMFNVGCDETVDLGQGRSRAEVAARGVGRVYLDFLRKIQGEVKARGRVMQFWGDIIIEHPELIPELPRDVIALEWGYEAEHPFADHCPRFAAAGIPFYVCPGTSTWNAIAGRTANALGNLRNAALNGLDSGAAGYLITDWGDNGHWQPEPIHDLGFAAGAAYSWALDANHELDLPLAVSLHAYADPTGVLGHVAYDLGDVYRVAGPTPANNSILSLALQRPLDRMPELSTEALTRTEAAIGAAIAPLTHARSARPDSELLAREFTLAARLLLHAVARMRFAHGGGDRAALAIDLREITAEYRAQWSARNRPGGLVDSVGRLERLAADYA
ncbi:MAG TPA: glycoside hydrolase family 20 zincin-like fold domain-containing protein [Anaerolineales bacterium]|nr:glycoside hydrolase family 20 zincin-like fold domain-containing protein [Anaerolineales bacterium]HRF47018.1 glycoside hydrolase family 20 zincin-like fold domain-containing protein [Anaerolineales bacterium]